MAARMLNNVRLAGFPLAYGVGGALVGGTLNRIMIADLGMPASLVALFFTVPMLVSPLRVWFGYRSDGYPLMGRRREPYIVLGAFLIGIGIVAVSSLITRLTGPAALTAPILLAFVVYGIGRNLGHNTFQALVSDRFSGRERTRAATLYEVATLLGMVMGSGILGKVLETYDPARLVAIAWWVALALILLALLAAIGQERSGAITGEAAERARAMPFGAVMRQIVVADPQVRSFFLLVLFTFVGTLAQDVILEPYGALVLHMNVGETTRLTSFWGLGVLISMLLSGGYLLRRFRHLTVLRAGIIASILVFLGLIIAGLVGKPGLMKGMVFFMGVGTGLAGAGMLSAAISFTTHIRAGMLMGVWGVANLMGHAAGSLMGGTLVDLVRAATGNNLAAYGTVFASEVIMLIIALYLSTRVSVEKSLAGREESAQVQEVSWMTD
jgi:BCD family chlorophyll transporter-like MFS transporter